MIPHLLVAAHDTERNTNTTGLQTLIARTDQHTFYRDGAWIAVDKGYGAAYGDGSKPDVPDPRDLYHAQLLKRFETLRHTLRQRGADRTLQQNADARRSSPVKTPSNRHEWLYTIDREYPTRIQICQLDEISVRRGLEYCAHAIGRFETISSQKSCWIWTLLALSGDVGTLDSQKMSHIRDIGAKAGEMSAGLHSGSARHTTEPLGDSIHTGLVGVEQSDESERVCCDAGIDDRNSKTGYVQSRVSEELHSEAEKTRIEDVPGTPAILIESHKSTNTESNDDSLERARARLLAQLGDNLVQAGIPATPDTGHTHLHHSARPDPGTNESQHEVRIRALPSRAEAERQRQLMREKNSATASLEEEVLPQTGLSATLHSVGSAYTPDDFDLNTRVTIDMILTVVAECYGQRDLLRFRKPW